MLGENIKNLRKEKGLSQEELASRLNVVRQTVSKWEQNISVPDSEMLISLAEIFEVSVGVLLGETTETKDTKSELEEISQKLENLNALLAENSSRTRRVLIIIAAIIMIAVSTILIAFAIISLIRILQFVPPFSSVGIIGGADGPTQIFVSSQFDWFRIIIAVIVAALLIGVSVFLLKRIRR